jgi:hypothetical protein
MNVISTPAATTPRGPAQAASTSTAAQDSGSPSFEDLLSRTRRDSPEGKDDADSKRTQRDRDRKEETDASPQDTLRLLESQAQQNQTPPSPIAALKTAAPDAPTAESATEDHGGLNLLPAGEGEGGEGTAASSQSIEASYGSRPGFSVNTPPSAEVTPRPASPSSDAANPSAGTTLEQASLASSGAGAPAKSSAGPDTAVQGKAVEETFSPLNPNKIHVADADGTPAAKERRNMPEQPKEQLLKPSANTAAGTSAADGASLPPVQEKVSAPRRIEPEPSGAPASVVSSAAATEFRGQAATPIQVADPISPATTAEFHAATHFVEHTMETAERVSLRGDNHVEVQMRLPGGKDVTVSLHLANGEWKPVFKTESQSLCQALEQSWQRTAAQPSDRAVRFGTPVFESSQSQAGLAENSGRQPDARDRHSARQEQAEIFPVLPARNRPASAAADAARLTATGQVRLYA